MPDVLADGILAVATFVAALGIGGLILDALRAARKGEGGSRGELAWTLLWVIGLCALITAAWAR